MARLDDISVRTKIIAALGAIFLMTGMVGAFAITQLSAVDAAAGEIRAQIESMQTVTNDAVSAIGTISTTIGSISSIAAAVEEQGAATAEIARNVQEAARELGMQSETLKSEVANFLVKIRTA